MDTVAPSCTLEMVLHSLPGQLDIDKTPAVKSNFNI